MPTAQKENLTKHARMTNELRHRIDDELTLYGKKATLRVWAWRGWRLEPLDSTVPVEERSCYAPETDVLSRVRIGVHAALTEFIGAVLEIRKLSYMRATHCRLRGWWKSFTSASG